MRDPHNFWTVQVDTEQGMPYYKHFLTKRYAEKKFQEQVSQLREGCVTLSENYEFVKEFIKSNSTIIGV